MTQKENPPVRDVAPRQKSALILLFVTFFIDILGVGLVLTLSPYYVQQYPFFFGYRVEPGIAVGALAASYPLLQLIFSPFWGRLSDRVGRRPIILLSLFGNASAWVLFGLAHSLEMLFLARSLSGILSSASLPTVQAYIADSTPPEKRSVWIGIVVGMGFSFGFMLGPPIGGILGTSPWPSWMNAVAGILPHGQSIIASNHLAYPAFLAAIIAYTNFLVACRRLPESLSPEMREIAASHRPQARFDQLTQALSIPTLGSMLLILGISTFGQQALEQNVALYGNRQVSTTDTQTSWTLLTPAFVQGRAVYEIRYAPDTPPPPGELQSLQPMLSKVKLVPDPTLSGGTVKLDRHLVQEDTGIVLFVAALIVGLVQGGGLKKLLPRFGEVNLIIIGSTIGAVGFFAVPAVRTYLPLMLVGGIAFAGLSFIPTCLRGLISQDAAAHVQGSVLGVSESVRSLAMATGPLVGGVLYDRWAGLPFVLGGVCMLACGILGFRLKSLRPGSAPGGADLIDEATALAGPATG